jgi:hypothetical protein
MKGHVDEVCKGKGGKLTSAITRQKIEDREKGPVDFVPSRSKRYHFYGSPTTRSRGPFHLSRIKLS